ncbi:MAG: RNA-binding protein hfq [Candidatus Bathyarchaeia archaeon]
MKDKSSFNQRPQKNIGELVCPGMRVRIFLRNGKTVEGTIASVSRYEIRLIGVPGTPIIFKHAIDYMEVLS